MKPKPEPELTSCLLVSSSIRLRRLAAGDSLDHLTGMLHRAFARLGDMGLACACVGQTTELTRRRVDGGDCFVALHGDRIVGTVTLYAPEPASACPHYVDARTATLRQLGVDPCFQGRGIGTALLELAERWARDHGYARLALDTPEVAAHLLAYYQCRGFRLLANLCFPGRPYRSAVFAKRLIRAGGRRCRARAGLPATRPRHGRLPWTRPEARA